MDVVTYALLKKKVVDGLPDAVDDWLSDHVNPDTGYVLDSTLSMDNAAPPASAVGDLKTATDLNTVNVSELQLLTGQIIKIDIANANGNNYVLFPVEAGMTYFLKNTSDSSYIAVYSTNTKDASHDIETLVAGMYANRQVYFTANYDATYLRIWTNGTAIHAEINAEKNFKKTLDHFREVNGLAIAKSINLFNKYAITSGQYINQYGGYYDSDLYGITEYIPIANGETLHVNISASASQYYALYDENFVYVANTAVASTALQITGTSSAKYARFTFNLVDVDNITIYSGTAPDRYMPYNPIDGYVGNVLSPSNCFETNDAVITSKLTKVATTFETDKLFEDTVSSAVTSAYIDATFTDKHFYFICANSFSVYYDVLRFYDENHNIIGRIKGGLSADKLGIPLKLVPPKGTKYIKFAQYSGGVNNYGAGIYTGYFATFEDSVAEIVSNNYADTNYVLWLGTSIPEGATYPAESCKANGYKCINKSVGSSKLCFEGTYQEGSSTNKGKRLTATVAELEALYRVDVTNNVISEDTLDAWKNGSYERCVIPYVDGTADQQVSMIVIDHGFNDRSTIYDQLQDEENIDWTSDDRTTFNGAFKYLIDQIQAVNPFVKIVIAGYFTNTVTRLSFSYNGPQICKMQTLIGEKYNISVMKAWEHSQISMEYVAGTDDYISDFNTQYGTSYSKITPDTDGNITSLQLYCPDGMHPHSDLTGNCDKRLNAVYTKLLAHMI